MSGRGGSTPPGQSAALGVRGGPGIDLAAFPSVDNGPSNAICCKAGFVLLGEPHLEYPKGSLMRCNDRRMDLDSAGG